MCTGVRDSISLQLSHQFIVADWAFSTFQAAWNVESGNTVEDGSARCSFPLEAPYPLQQTVPENGIKNLQSSPMDVVSWHNIRIYPMRQKKQDTTLALNFAKCWPIFKILSPSDSVVNVKWNDHIPPHLKCVATLPREMEMSGNYKNMKQKFCLTINFNFISCS